MATSLDRADRILELIGQQRDGMTHAQIARTLNIPKSTLSQLLTQMSHLGYLALIQPGNVYILGPRLMVLASRFMNNQDIVQVGRPYIQTLASVLDETTFLGLKHGLEVLYVTRIDSNRQSIASSVRIGQTAPLEYSAAGKAILAFQADHKIRTHLDTQVSGPVVLVEDKNGLVTELDDIRANRVSCCREEFQEGITAFGSPVFDLEGRAIAAITVAIPTFRLTAEYEARVRAEILRTRDHLLQPDGF